MNLTKVAVGCTDVAMLDARLAGRAMGGETYVVTRYRPTRHSELIGGSLFWIVRHQLVARSPILGFAEAEKGHCVIRLAADLVPVRYRPKRAHQGWRYLTAADAPADLDGDEAEGDTLPPDLAGKLAALALI
ncbi:DUF1489 domain-containing protein [Sphingomonas sp. AP4-R1]|nr:DUF1489 domain-containing protein [Sphingomonas sp. AP4-R1]